MLRDNIKCMRSGKTKCPKSTVFWLFWPSKSASKKKWSMASIPFIMLTGSLSPSFSRNTSLSPTRSRSTAPCSKKGWMRVLNACRLRLTISSVNRPSRSILDRISSRPVRTIWIEPGSNRTAD
ncbi:hypothetical protein G6F36_015972 [Rhizopus arrhizus]|nr:hypothetical protein G6F36_015972 [Rhizopus arrhizus]